jgi:hypothetical protein
MLLCNAKSHCYIAALTRDRLLAVFRASLVQSTSLHSAVNMCFIIILTYSLQLYQLNICSLLCVPLDLTILTFLGNVKIVITIIMQCFFYIGR